MAMYRITKRVQWLDLGIFPGGNHMEAENEMAKALGYDSFRQLCLTRGLNMSGVCTHEVIDEPSDLLVVKIWDLYYKAHAAMNLGVTCLCRMAFAGESWARDDCAKLLNEISEGRYEL